ncbi:hypothetical protein [Acinetobacter colistiniresistens]|uniref:hypothetical protein n=1 Tax=Acinetobacter colistiniresistens TaxID=280145 RepID=UPI001250BFC9|nr:hypothetical protein [Acinetobacter colistiniresistens]
MTILQPIIDNVYQPSMAGTIAELAEVILEELEFSGESIAIEDAKKSIIDHAVLYAGWQSLHMQKQSTQPIKVDEDFELELGEWSILEPIVRAHLELIHSKRVDGSGAIAGERTGKDPITAATDYNTAKAELGKNAFCEEVFSV